ncbi:uncharacterized protein MKK02DRAFT_43298 [Dioszegia hungarica]|uniref:Uncharacterized protein n=1 Tax=Dioszegia hungarica TaxID=4972 RepID=A0AA38HC83_9TREE|nr:uncharacterized protein MKK02DRAFT_43298 [Dioszegia hungarica]KAI9637372.1 hypothetical protein MKK02DRAFT_43298 [Dioszegia hungarica]
MPEATPFTFTQEQARILREPPWKLNLFLWPDWQHKTPGPKWVMHPDIKCTPCRETGGSCIITDLAPIGTEDRKLTIPGPCLECTLFDSGRPSRSVEPLREPMCFNNTPYRPAPGGVGLVLVTSGAEGEEESAAVTSPPPQYQPQPLPSDAGTGPAAIPISKLAFSAAPTKTMISVSTQTEDCTMAELLRMVGEVKQESADRLRQNRELVKDMDEFKGRLERLEAAHAMASMAGSMPMPIPMPHNPFHPDHPTESERSLSVALDVDMG